MNLQSVVENLLRDTLDTSLPLFIPELILCGTIVAMLLFRLFARRGGNVPFFLVP